MIPANETVAAAAPCPPWNRDAPGCCMGMLLRSLLLLLLALLLATRPCICSRGAAGGHHQRQPSSPGSCNASLRTGWSVGQTILRTSSQPSTAACCAACVSEPRCAAFVLDGRTCFLKADGENSHAKPGQTAGFVRVPAPAPGPAPSPGPPAPPPAPTPPAPPGSPQWETVEATPTPLIDKEQGAAHGIFAGFETGQYQRIGDTFYITANELGMCRGVVWDLVTRAALWSAPNSTGPWSRITTLRNGSHIQTLCENAPCRHKCGPSCCSGTETDRSFVTWAPTLVYGPSSVNESGKDVWSLFYSSNQNSHMKDDAFNGITWAVSTTDSMEGTLGDTCRRPCCRR